MDVSVEDNIMQELYDDHPSLTSSLEYEINGGGYSSTNLPAMMDIPAPHVSHRSSPSRSSESDSGGSWSPPMGQQMAWHLSPNSSRHTSPEYEDAPENDVTLQPVMLCPDPPEIQSEIQATMSETETLLDHTLIAPKPESYLKFSLRADFQHRFDRKIYASPRWLFAAGSIVVLALAFIYGSPPPELRGVPDLHGAAHLAGNFETLLPFSEQGFFHHAEWQRTSAAVWDLGDQVRTANLTSGDLIMKQLAELGETLDQLGASQGRFYAQVDGDINNILYAMELHLRLLTHLPSPSPLYDRPHQLLSSLGILADRESGQPTTTGSLILRLLGPSHPQATVTALRAAFDAILSAVESSIENELSYSTRLLDLFEAVDQQFRNLVRSVGTESTEIDRAEGELLGRLWSRMFGAAARQAASFQKNRILLTNLRNQTVSHRGVVVAHKRALESLKYRLERARREISAGRRKSSLLDGGLVLGATLGVGEHIDGLIRAVGPFRKARDEHVKAVGLLHRYASDHWAAKAGGRTAEPGIEEREAP